MLDVILLAGQSIASDVVLVPGARPTADVWMQGDLADVTLLPARRETSRDAGYEPPPPLYFGVLQKWTGAAWVKAKLLRYTGAAWVQAKLRKWNGTEWKEFNVTGE